MIILPEQVNKAIEMLEAEGYDAYIAGGCVRELLVGESIPDFDIATNAGINDILYTFRDYRISDEGKSRGEILVTIAGVIIQIAPYRKGVVGNRVFYAETLEEDLFCRGFSVDAMAYSPKDGLIDPFGGHLCMSEDKKLLVAVGENTTRTVKVNGKKTTEEFYDMSRCFTDKPSRILEAVRRCAEEDYSIEENTRLAIMENIECFSYAEKELVRRELTRIVTGRYVTKALIENHDILSAVIPEILPCVGLEQRSPHHEFTVWEHIARATGFVQPEPVLRFAMLFHDIGKPDAMFIDFTGRGHFRGHAERSRLLAEGIMRRLEFDTEISEEISKLIYRHDMDIPEDKKQLKALMRSFGAQELKKLLLCEIADNRAKHENTECEPVPTLRRALAALNEIIDSDECYDIRSLAVTKRDLMERRLVRNEREAEELLNVLFEIVLDKPSFNNKLMLLDMAERSKSKLEQIAAERERKLAEEQRRREELMQKQAKKGLFSRKDKRR